MTTRYLSTTEFAQRVGVAVDTLKKYALPTPDAVIGTKRGWTEDTIDTWNATRPGRGNWGRRTTTPQGKPHIIGNRRGACLVCGLPRALAMASDNPGCLPVVVGSMVL